MSIFFVVLLSLSSAFAQTDLQSKPKSRGNAFNPDIGINALTLYRSSNRGGETYVKHPNGLGLQEVEIQLSGDVDPYWRFNSTLSLHEDIEVDTGTTPPTRTASMKFEPEEIYAETTSLPYVTFKIGKFFTTLSRHNQLHTHEYPFVDTPLMNETLLGEHGFNDTGISLSGLLPTSWFSELTLQGVSGRGEGLSYYSSPSANTVVGVARWKNLWDISEDLTFEIGVSSAQGENAQRQSTKFQGSDFTWKWRQNPTQALIWSFEMLNRQKNEATDEKANGYATWIQYQASQRWWVQVRTEQLDIKDQDPAAATLLPEKQTKQSALIGYVPSEFSSLRLQFDQLDDNSSEKEKRLLLQFNFSIGAHPAHNY